MLVVNALFFKGTWRRQFFSSKNTYMGKFYTSTNISVDVPFMTTIDRFYYSESSELDAQILRIPYDVSPYQRYSKSFNTLTAIAYYIVTGYRQSTWLNLFHTHIYMYT